MYLKSLEIQGFKSFADKVKLDFGPGITAVVGPNGSGKSNISDCIRWVLGEQSAKTLRGSKMEDVIFAGSSERRALGMAEVSLTLDNSSGILSLPYQEITISRRVFRSGEGEYLINKTPCRLKDVHDLFNDTGLGKESFAIIGQGKVEEVLNSKAEERRALIEEAAGIIKYRNRKREALKKLDETEQNLNRILDIIAELSASLGPLKIQAEKALEYKGYKSELDKLEINIAYNKLQVFHEKLTALSQDIEERSKIIESMETSCQTMDSKIEHSKLQLSYLEEELSILQKTIVDLGEQQNKLEHFLAVSEEKNRSLISQYNRITDEIANDKERQKVLQKKFDSQILAHQHLKEQIEIKEQSIAETEKETSKLDNRCLEIENILDKLKNNVFECLQNLANARNRYNQVCYEKNSCIQNIARNYEKIEQLKEEMNKGTLLIKDLEKSCQEKRTQIVKISDLKTTLTHDKVKIEADLKKSEDMLKFYNKEIQTLSSKHLALLDLQNDYEGYFQGVKAILKAKADQNPFCSGIAGVVGELISVPAEYEVAIEVALGSSIQNLIAINDKAAEEAIYYLKQANKGRATFLPLNTIKVREIKNEYKNLLAQNGVIGIASSLVDISSPYLRVIKHLLGNILVVDSLETARFIGKKSSFNLKIVTLDGDIINPGGALTGGSINKKSAALLARPREIKELEEALEIKRIALAELESQVSDYNKSLLNVTQRLVQLEDQIQKDNLSVLNEEHVLNNAKQTIERLDKELKLIMVENSQLDKQLDSYNQSEKQQQKLIADFEAKNQALEKEHGQRHELYKLEQEKNRLKYNHLTALKIELAALLEKDKAYKEDLSDYYVSEKELTKLLEQRSQELVKLDMEKKELLNAIELNNLKLKEVVIEKTELKNKASTKEAKRDELRLVIESLEKDHKTKLKEVNNLKETFQNQKILYARLETEKNNEEVRLEEKFQIKYEKIEQPITFKDSPEIHERVKRLKKTIANLGEINLAAIEEYNRQKERHDFLKRQEEDLNEARSVLNKVIVEVDQIMIKRFTQAFEEVNSAFGDIYQKLFSGGKAFLQLASPEDLLETGVDIVVQPPGKKLQNLTLLSGGERALTVIALLFALLSVKPSPFCVLDEIESSLDEVNVDKFAHFLRLFAEKTQFVIISHRQGTIEVADALYGVTMEESGISKLVSVRLTEKSDLNSTSA